VLLGEWFPTFFRNVWNQTSNYSASYPSTAESSVLRMLTDSLKKNGGLIINDLLGRANWIGHILRRNCLLQRVTEGKIQGGIEVTGRQGRGRRKLLMTLRKGEDTLI